MPEVESIPVRLIARKWDLWPRAELDWDRVSEFAALMKEEGADAFPPVILCGPYSDGRYTVEDGFHRVEAATEAGVESLSAVVQPIKADADLRFEMVRHSAVASKTLTMAEKRAVAPILRDEGRGISEIARALGVARNTLYRWFEDAPAAAEGSQREPEEPALGKARSFLRSFRGLRQAVEGGNSHELGEEVSPYLAQAAEEQFGEHAADWLGMLYWGAYLAYQEFAEQ